MLECSRGLWADLNAVREVAERILNGSEVQIDKAVEQKSEIEIGFSHSEFRGIIGWRSTECEKVGIHYETETEIRSARQQKVKIRFEYDIDTQAEPGVFKVANRKLVVSIRYSESIRIDAANESIRIENRPALAHTLACSEHENHTLQLIVRSVYIQLLMFLFQKCSN